MRLEVTYQIPYCVPLTGVFGAHPCAAVQREARLLLVASIHQNLLTVSSLSRHQAPLFAAQLDLVVALNQGSSTCGPDVSSISSVSAIAKGLP
jgi:hypothetical protein